MKRVFKTSIIMFMVALPIFVKAQIVRDNSFKTVYPRTEMQRGSSFVATDSSVLPITLQQRISGLSVSGNIIFTGDKGFVRIVLIDSNENEYLVLETNTIFENDTSVSFNEFCKETALLNNVFPKQITVECTDAQVTINGVQYAASNTYQTSRSKQIRDDQLDAKFQYINAVLEQKEMTWRAGKTSLAEMSYMEKKNVFGGRLPNLAGFDYYIGGIYVMQGYKPDTNNQTRSQFVPEFDWRNRHGANNPSSPYYNSGGKGWITSVKDQGNCGSCWAFSAVGTVEAYTNLYYNRFLNLNLSEQNLVSCPGGGGTCNGGNVYNALKYIVDTGVVNETCFPYSASNGVCSTKCSNPAEKIKIGTYTGFDLYRQTPDDIKKIVMRAPTTFEIGTWSHALVLVGFKTIQEGEKIYIQTSLNTGSWITINQGNPYIGTTAWILKNSWGDYNNNSWYNGRGYGYVIVDSNDNAGGFSIFGNVTSLNYTNDSIICEDRDGDGYYYWGIGPKPATCPCEAPNEPDCDDSNPDVGPMDTYGYCMPIKLSCTASYSCLSDSLNSVTVEWESRQNAATYVLEYSLAPDFSTIIGADTLPYNTTSYFFTERAAGTTYYFRIVAYNSAGDYAGYGKTSFTYPDIFPNASGVLFVKKGGSGDKGGYDWGNAHGEFSTALVAARANSCIKQIWVSDGTYYPTTTNDRNLSFNLPQNVKIYGGFPSSGNPIWANRDWVNNPTILSGNIRDTTIITDNSYTVVTASRNTYLDGFFVTGGYGASGIQASGNAELRNLRVYQNRATQAGGIAITKGIGIGDPTLTNCIIHSNAADFEGGGIGIFSGSPYLDHITIFGNVAATGGGLAVISGTPYFDSITLFGNLAQMSGGGIAVLSGTPRFYRMDIHHNHAHQGGGLAALGGCAKIERASIYNNHAFYQGGGIYVDSRGIRGGTTIEGENENYSERDTNFIAEEDGTIIRAPAIPDTRLYAKYIDIFGNYADGHGGGGIACLNDLYPYYPIMPIFENVAIHENQTPNNGGGVFNDNSEILFLNSLFYDNIGGNGAEIAGFANSSIILVHATITKTNIPPMNPEIVTMGQLELYNSIVCLNGFSPPPLGNNYIVPGNCSAIFVDDTNGNYTLTTPLSTAPFDLSQFLNRIYPHGLLPPCGLPSGLLQTDLAGYPRITNGRSNYGVYEYGSSPHWKSMNYNEEQKEEQQKPISKEVSGGNLQIYPNPTTGELKIESGELKITDIQVFDVVGKKLFSLSTINNTQATLNIKSLYNGMYFIKITTEDGRQWMKKIVKEK